MTLNKEILDNQELNSLIKEFDSDVTLNLGNLREKSMMCSSIRSKWLGYYYKEKENVERIRRAKAKIISLKMSEVKSSDSILRLKSEENISKNDEKIKKLNIMAEQTQTCLDYIERCLDQLSTFNFNIKNIIDILKLNADS